MIIHSKLLLRTLKTVERFRSCILGLETSKAYSVLTMAKPNGTKLNQGFKNLNFALDRFTRSTNNKTSEDSSRSIATVPQSDKTGGMLRLETYLRFILSINILGFYIFI